MFRIPRTALFAAALLCSSGCTRPDASVSGAPTAPAPLEEEASRKKLIEFGWDNPKAAFVRQNVARMEQTPFSGFTLQLSVGSDVFNKTAYPENAYAQDRANLRATKFTQLTDNFVRMDTRHEEGWSWLSDADWAAARENVRQFARTAKAGRFKGIFFDPEPYGLSPWRFSSEKYGGERFAEVSNVVRARGRDFIRVIHQELPGAKILSTYLVKYLRAQLEDAGGVTQDMDYALLLPFFEGWMDAAQGETFIEGNEGSYYALSEKNFLDDRAYFQESKAIVSSENQPKFARSVRMANAAYVDGVMDLFRSPRFIGYYFASDAERLRLLEHNIYYGLEHSDQYVWVYSESMNWWTGQVPAGVQEAVLSALKKVNAGQPLGFDVKPSVDAARVEFDRKVGIYGKITQNGEGLQSAQVLSGFTDPQGEESACVVYNDLGQYGCTVPYGWSGTLRPTLDGKTFDPPSRGYLNLTRDVGDQDFSAP